MLTHTLRRSIFLFSALLLSAFILSCSSDDDGVVEEENILIGTWQLTHIDLTVFEDSGFPASDPCIVELVSGYDFAADQSFYFVLGEDSSFLPDPYQSDYWEWEGDVDNFEISQRNPAMPPYDFSLNPTNIDVKKVDGKWHMTFHSEMSNGSAANFSLVKQPLDLSLYPAVTAPDGSPYHCGFFD